MKPFIYACFAIIVFASCNASEPQPEVAKINAAEISPSPVVHDSLTAEQMEKVVRIQKTFAEVFPATLEETITNFKRDQNPDKEITVWLNMANVYEAFVRKHAVINLAKKHEVFKLILLQSMMSDEEALMETNPQTLNKKEIEELLKSYDANAVPITVEKR
ncbi:MAG TPA: hypothetical protein VMR70_01875 [Flavisolibacter sp.]|nr:hypothetical protein [Flavisolibacter sp.]